MRARTAAGAALGAALAACALAAPSAAAPLGVRAQATVAEIAKLGPRAAGSANERRAAAIAADRLAELGYRVTRQRVPLPRGGESLNVVGRSPGPLRAVVVAHVDGVHGTVAANDNASGVAVLLELARVLAGRRGLLFAALGAEERHTTGSPVHLGSQRLLASLGPRTRRTIRLALSLDMVGVGTALNVRGLEAAPNRSARLALAHGGRYLADTGQSDHAELTRAGIPAAWITWRWDRCWHLPCDGAARVKSWKLGAAGRLALAAVRDALRDARA